MRRYFLAWLMVTLLLVIAIAQPIQAAAPNGIRSCEACPVVPQVRRPTAIPTATSNLWGCEVAPPGPEWQCIDGQWVFVPSPTPTIN